jgi:tyrosine-protein kinase Etk/Wzc
MENEFDFGGNKTSILSSYNLKAELYKYVSKWYWILLSVLLFYAIGQIYLRYQIPIYSAQSKLLIKNVEGKDKNMSSLGVQGFDKFLSNPTESIENQIEILNSRDLTGRVISKLNLNVDVKTKGKIVKNDLYDNSPLHIIIDSVAKHKINQRFFVKILSKNSYQKLVNEKDDNSNIYKFGEKIITENGSFIIKLNPKVNYDEESLLEINLRPTDDLTGGYLSRLKVEPIEKSAVLQLSFTDKNLNRAKDFLNELIKEYDLDAVRDLSLVSKSTDDFIRDRLAIIADELNLVEKNQENFKRNNNVVDPMESARIYLGNKNDFNRQIVETETQLRVIDFLSSHLNKGGKELMPMNMLPFDNGKSTELIAQYNQLILEKNRFLNNSGTKNNPIVDNLDEKIVALKKNINESVRNLRTSVQLQLNELTNQENIANSKFANLPRQERELRDILRQQKVKESLYLYLLQRKEETAISLAIKPSNSKTIDKAYSTGMVHPKSENVKNLMLLLGLLIPIIIIYIIGLFDTKIKTQQDIENLGIPYLGDIPHSIEKNRMIEIQSRDSVSEAFRILRTNLNFLLTNTTREKNIAKKIFVTSTISGEGKTFVSINLATVLSLVDQKVLLLGMDIRNPKLSQYLEKKNNVGLTHYLSDDNVKIEEIITKDKRFDYISSGAIPPNPSELLSSSKVEELFKYLEDKYEYIVVDTAPTSLVTDTFVISKFSDVCLYVCRSNYLEKPMLKLVSTFFKEKRLNNMALILNDTSYDKGYKYMGYAYKYGYTQRTNVEKTFLSKIFSFFNKK